MADNISRGRLLKRAGVGAAALWAAPVLTSGAQAGHGGRHTCGRGQQCAGDPCFNQTACRPFDPSCSCIQRTAGPNVDFVCFCHQGSFCGDLPPCTRQADCPAGWECAASCCSYDPGDLFCHPPCGENVNGGELRPLAGATSIGYIAR